MRRILHAATKILVWSALTPGLAAAAPAPDEIRAELGRRLFYDADLSINGTMACATCHEQRRGFADGNRSHPGALDDPGRRNVPGLQNVSALHHLTWASRTPSLERQALTPLFGEHPIEMAMRGHESELTARLAANPCYVRLFAAAFPAQKGVISIENLTSALASFERRMISFNAPYDQAARGEAPLSAKAQAGRALFVGKAGCASCHGGENFTDDDFHALEPPSAADRGLAEESGQEADAGLFRTPSLRNFSLTAPYFHDGRANDLTAALARHHLPTALSARETSEIAAFLDTLTDSAFVADKRLALPDEACPL